MTSYVLSASSLPPFYFDFAFSLPLFLSNTVQMLLPALSPEWDLVLWVLWFVSSRVHRAQTRGPSSMVRSSLCLLIHTHEFHLATLNIHIPDLFYKSTLMWTQINSFSIFKTIVPSAPCGVACANSSTKCPLAQSQHHTGRHCLPCWPFLEERADPVTPPLSFFLAKTFVFLTPDGW